MSTRGPITVLDVGGTHVRHARWSPEEGLGEVTDTPSPSRLRHPGMPLEELRGRLLGAICDAVPAGPAPVAALSFGAALDQRTGTVYGSAPLFGDETTPLDLPAALGALRPDVEWHVLNDVTAALLHYASHPRHHGRRKVLLLTVSSGIACRTIDLRTGAIATDPCGLQGEVGHLPAYTRLAGHDVELTCDCGRPGHVAAYSSGPGLRRMADVLRDRAPDRWQASSLGRAMAGGTSFEEALATALDHRDPLAAELLDAATAPVADVLRTALSLDPELDDLAVTGGVATGLGRHYKASLDRHFAEEGLYLTSDLAPRWLTDRVTVCAPGEANGLIGAGIGALRGTVTGAGNHATRRVRPARAHYAVVRDEAGLHYSPRPTPDPGPGDVLVAPMVAGVCGTDLQMLRGIRDDGAPVIGHEGVARIVAVGEDVQDPALHPGVPVVVNPTHPEDDSFLLGHNVDGLLQERALVPATAVRAGLVLPLPEVPPGVLGALVEPLAVARYAALALGEHRPRTLLVFGDGTVGHLAVRTARRWYGPDVRTVHVHHTPAGLVWSNCAPHSADVRLLSDGLSAERLARALGDGPLAVLIATPAPATLPALELALEAAAGTDTVVDLVGGLPRSAASDRVPGADLTEVRAANRAGRPQPPYVARFATASGHKVRILGHRGVAGEHLRYAAAELCRAPERYRDLVTHVVDLPGAVPLLARLATSTDRIVSGRRLVKMAVRMGEPS
ncbi:MULTISPECIES: ROK family protein [unclassified Streptomyces]|uniref:ROK family protein n=1 Tax=unclassified Streptomyces TaxID=2593676 RepID=UPI0036E715F5